MNASRNENTTIAKTRDHEPLPLCLDRRISPKLISIILVLLSWTLPSQAEDIEIPDPVLEALVRQHLGNPNDPITRSEMESLSELDGGGTYDPESQIQSLQGLQAATKLELLDLSLRVSNDTDLSPLGALSELKTLDLSYNKLTSFTLPPELTKLTYLYVSGNQLTELTLPPSLTKLTTLEFGYNRLTELILPPEFTSLTSLYLVDNQLTELTIPPSLTKLTTLVLVDNQLTDLTIPAGLSNLANLWLSGNSLNTLRLSKSLTSLKKLSLEWSTAPVFELLEAPSGLTSLTMWNRHGTALTSLTLPAGMISLERLDLGYNDLTSLELPGDMSALTYLDLSRNGMESLTLHDGFTRPRTFYYFTGNNFPLPPDPEIAEFTLLERTEESTVVQLAWVATLGMSYRVEVSRDLREWREHRQNGSGWEFDRNDRPYFVPPSNDAQLNLELEGGLDSVYVRIRGFEPAPPCRGHGCGGAW